MIIDRNEYIEQLLAKCWNGKVKIVTGKSTIFSKKMEEFQKKMEEFLGKLAISSEKTKVFGRLFGQMLSSVSSDTVCAIIFLSI